MKRNIVPRFLLSFLGILVILWGAGSVVLGFVGEHETAVITNLRRQGGERNDGRSGRYTYSIGYTFTLPDGIRIEGSSTQIGGAVYVKSDGSSTLPVRYLKSAPFINAPEDETRLSLRQPLLVIAGTLVIVATNKK